MGRTIAIGDIHGCRSALGALLNAIDPEPADTLVLLGDLIDYGLESRGVLDLVLSLGSRCRLVTILGNHEEMILAARRSRKDREFWLGAGGQASLDSYGYDAGLNDIPTPHWRFLESCVPFFETETHFFVHANYVADLPFDEQPTSVQRWLSLADSIPGPHCSGRIAVVGHTPQTSGDVLDLGHLLCLDTNCVGGGRLTALDVNTRRVWQADERGRFPKSLPSAKPLTHETSSAAFW